jgi:hypothetical protein
MFAANDWKPFQSCFLNTCLSDAADVEAEDEAVDEVNDGLLLVIIGLRTSQ